MKTILTVGCEIPGGIGEYVDFYSKTSLLDADFILFRPAFHLSDYHQREYYLGKPTLSETLSFGLQDAIGHWRKELADYLNAGKTVFLIMSRLEEVYVSTGEKKYSGTGRNRITTRIVQPVSNYDLLPVSRKIYESEGNQMILHSEGHILKEYWQLFGEESQYHAHIEKSNHFRPLVITRHGHRIVGAMFQHQNGGTLLALPWIDFDRQEFVSEEDEDNVEKRETWTHKAIAWGQKYFRTLESLDKAIRSQTEITPIPQWARDDSFKTNRETALSEERLRIQTKISALEKNREEIEEQLANAGSLKALLFGQGQALKNAILEAMTLMGFKANTYRDSDSEFDAVLECSEGRCIGEAEGRDRKPINIDKMRQLEVNILEDLARDEVREPAKGILFGNAYRLYPPRDRPAEHFTAKCKKAAERNGTVLIRTCDLFEVAKSLADKPNTKLAASCREAILDTVGKEIQFPSLPGSEVEPRSNGRYLEKAST